MQIASQIKGNLKIASVYGLIVSAAFWIPDIIIHGFSGKSFSSPEVRIMTFLLPIVAALSFYVLRNIRQHMDNRVLSIFSSVLGIWVTGPFFMMISASFSGGGFSRTDAGFFEQLAFIVTCTAGFPIFTFMMSTYDGTLFAVLITTVLLPIIGFISRHSHMS